MDVEEKLRQDIDGINVQINSLDETRNNLLNTLKDLEEQLLFVMKIVNNDEVKRKFKELFDKTDQKESDI